MSQQSSQTYFECGSKIRKMQEKRAVRMRPEFNYVQFSAKNSKANLPIKLVSCYRFTTQMLGFVN